MYRQWQSFCSNDLQNMCSFNYFSWRNQTWSLIYINSQQENPTEQENLTSLSNFDTSSIEFKWTSGWLDKNNQQVRRGSIEYELKTYIYECKLCKKAMLNKKKNNHM